MLACSLFEKEGWHWFSTLNTIYLDVTGKKHLGKFHSPEATYVEGMETSSEMPPEGREKGMEEKSDTKGSKPRERVNENMGGFWAAMSYMIFP